MMTAKMKPAESATAFIARLNKLFLDADIESMVADDFKSFILIAGITNQQLRKKLLDMNGPMPQNHQVDGGDKHGKSHHLYQPSRNY